MNTAHVNYGQSYRLARAALQLRSFTMSELQGVTGALKDTIHSFLSRLSAIDSGFLQSNNVEGAGRGRPRKRYRLTETGADYLRESSARMLAQFAVSEEVQQIPRPAERGEPAAFPMYQEVASAERAMDETAVFVVPDNASSWLKR